MKPVGEEKSSRPVGPKEWTLLPYKSHCRLNIAPHLTSSSKILWTRQRCYVLLRAPPAPKRNLHTRWTSSPFVEIGGLPWYHTDFCWNRARRDQFDVRQQPSLQRPYRSALLHSPPIPAMPTSTMSYKSRSKQVIICCVPIA